MEVVDYARPYEVNALAIKTGGMVLPHEFDEEGMSGECTSYFCKEGAPYFPGHREPGVYAVEVTEEAWEHLGSPEFVEVIHLAGRAGIRACKVDAPTGMRVRSCRFGDEGLIKWLDLVGLKSGLYDLTEQQDMLVMGSA